MDAERTAGMPTGRARRKSADDRALRKPRGKADPMPTTDVNPGEDLNPDPGPSQALLDRAHDYIAAHPGQDGAGIVRELIESIVELGEYSSRLHDALLTAEAADEQANNCDEHEPENAPESCGACFPLADDARTKRWAALGINQPRN